MRTLLNLFRDYVSPASSENGDEDTKDRVKKDFEDDEDTVRVLDDGLEGQAIEEGNGNQVKKHHLSQYVSLSTNQTPLGKKLINQCS